MKIDVLTLFPEMFEPMNHSFMKRAQEKGILDFNTRNFREFATNKHGHVDDYPFGGGAGMLLQVEPIVNMLESLNLSPEAEIVLVDPTGEQFSQTTAQEWSQKEQLVFVCGHYEGFDERIRSYVTREVSLGDYVLTNGELPAMVMIDATVRLIPDVVGNAESIVAESHQNFLLEHPQYTRPRIFRNQEVPEILFSGHHENIRLWERKEALRRTRERRLDLLEKAQLTQEDQKLLREIEKEMKRQ